MQHVSEKIREYTEELGFASPPNPAWARKAQVAPPPVEAKMGCGNPFLASLSVSWSSLSQKINDQYLVCIFIHFLFTFACSSQKYIYIHIHVRWIHIHRACICNYLCVIMCIHTCACAHVQISVGILGTKPRKTWDPKVMPSIHLRLPYKFPKSKRWSSAIWLMFYPVVLTNKNRFSTSCDVSLHPHCNYQFL